jgi:hypothetical protein
MKARGAPDPYSFDAEGKLVVPEGTTEEQQVVVEAAVLHKEGLSGNHPADVAAQYAEEESEEPPVNETDTSTRRSGYGSAGDDDHSKRDDDRKGRHTPRGRDR